MVKYLKTVAAMILAIMACGAVYGQRFDRGIDKRIFVPKGQWLTGGSFSYSQIGADDYKFLVLDDMQGDGYTMSISPFLGYFVKNNLAVGARFGYKRTFYRIDNIAIDLGDDLSFEIKDYYNLQHVYYGTAMMRNYINLGDSKRFGLFNEVQLTVGGGQGKIVSGKGDDLTGTYQNIYEFQLGMAPGMAAFLTNEVAVEVSVGVLGFNYRKIDQLTDQTYKGSYTKSSANFKIDIFSISIGVAFYVPTMNPRVGKHVGNMFRSKEKRKP